MNSTVSATSVTTSTDHDKHQELSPTYKVLLAVLIIQSVVTCVGNAMTIIVVYRDAALRTLGNIHVVSLAYADFIAGLTGLFDVIWFINKDVTTFFSYCKFCCLLWYILFFVSFAASLFSMSLIALDRWIFIAYPLRYYIWITPLKTTFLIGSAWTAAMLFGLLPAAINTFDTNNQLNSQCSKRTSIFNVSEQLMVRWHKQNAWSNEVVWSMLLVTQETT
ncbi:beta-1 adrenergic receptor-like [Gigantopelta aegis]|uniref:beta-1 adrenergic receptor-like n=1 Tax=Gigantopelta aegis TaxID=1735272 RepID=UPI001B88AE0E|nr:beta-1 adrenergic receptor-like [Gigantopelta aegis]